MKKFNQETTFKARSANVMFFLNQAIEWNEKGFTAVEMATAMCENDIYIDFGFESVRSRVYDLTRRYCKEVDIQTLKQLLKDGKKSKRFKLRTEFI